MYIGQFGRFWEEVHHSTNEIDEPKMQTAPASVDGEIRVTSESENWHLREKVDDGV